MARIEIELTSSRDDGTWTWRAAGARQPRGSLDGGLLPDGSGVGDVLRAETEQYVDGMEITAVLPPKATRSEPELLEIIGSGRSQPAVTTKLAGKGRRREPGGDRDERPGRGSRDDRRTGRGRGRERERGDDRRPARGRGEDRRRSGEGDGMPGRRSRAEGRRGDGREQRRSRGSAADNSPPPPRPKRLRPKRRHRKAAMEALPEDQRLMAEHLLRGGVPGLREAVTAQNAAAVASGEPEIPVELLVRLGERINPRLRSADWLDRAEAALAGIEKVDLRDIRSVIVAAESAARTDEARDLAEQLRTGLSERVDREHAAWMEEVGNTLGEGRVVRALRLSSRPVKAGFPLPAPLLDSLTEAANASLTSDTGQDRWATVLDAVALSPVHQRVVPQGLPSEPNESLLEVVKRVSTSVPDIAAAFGVEPTAPPRRRRPRRSASA